MTRKTTIYLASRESEQSATSSCTAHSDSDEAPAKRPGVPALRSVEGGSREDELGGDSVDSASDDDQDALQSIAAVDSLILEGCGSVRNYHFSSFTSSAILHYDD